MRKFVIPFAVLTLVGTSAIAATPATSGDVRDWKAIDRNADHLVSADEMESFLKQQWEKAAQNPAPTPDKQADAGDKPRS